MFISTSLDFIFKLQKAAQEVDEVTGQAKRACIIIDAMTEMTTRSSRSAQNGSDADAYFATRVFGAKVVCGDVNGYFLYTTDNFIAKGGDVMVEVQRQVFYDLDRLLWKKHRHTLRGLEINLQYDNGPENKVKITMFVFTLSVVNFKHFQLFCLSVPSYVFLPQPPSREGILFKDHGQFFDCWPHALHH
jgi:hypothetical protein